MWVALLLFQALDFGHGLKTPPSELEKMLIPMPLQVYMGNHSVGEVMETLEHEAEAAMASGEEAQGKSQATGATGAMTKVHGGAMSKVAAQTSSQKTLVTSNKADVDTAAMSTENAHENAAAPPAKTKSTTTGMPSMEVNSPLMKSASAEVQAQVKLGVKRAVKEGLAEMEEAAKEAQQKWVSEAAVVTLEDQAKLKKAVALDLEQVNSKVQAVQGVQQKVLQRMQREVQAAVANITQKVLTESAAVARNQSFHAAKKVLSPSLAAIGAGEATIEALRNEALVQQEDAETEASRLSIAARKAQSYLHNLTQMPQAVAEELHKMVDQDLVETEKAKVDAQVALDAMTKAKDEADATLNLANATEAEAQEILRNAVAQAEKIRELERRAKHPRGS